jgi:hypothetical protein
MIGSEQYWLARPFDWRTVLGAKLLFVVLFVNVPLFLYQIAVLAYNLFAPMNYLAALLSKQFFFSAFMLLPVIAIAAVTKTLWQTFVGFSVLLFLYSIASRTQFEWGNLVWIRFSAVAVVAAVGFCLVIALQYARRWTLLSRGLLAGVALLATLIGIASPSGPAYLLQQRQSARQFDAYTVQISPDPSRMNQILRKSSYDPRLRELRIPIRLDNIPAGLELENDWTAVDVQRGGKRHPVSHWNILGSIYQPLPGQNWLVAFLPKDKLAELEGHPVELVVSVGVTLSEVKTARPIDLWGVDVPGLGVCQPVAGDPHCLTPFPYFGYAPYSFSNRFSPLARKSLSLDRENEVVIVKRPVAHLARAFMVTLQRLEDHLTPED